MISLLALAVSLNAVAFEPGHTYVSDFGGVHVFDPDGIEVDLLTDVRLQLPGDLAFSPDGRRLFVLDRIGLGVVVFDANGDFIDTWNAGLLQPRGIVAARDGTVYVADQLLGGIRVLGDIGQVLGLLSDNLLTFPTDVMLSPDGAQLFVSSALTDGGLHIFDTANGVYEGLVPGSDTDLRIPKGLGVSPDGTIFVSDLGDGEVKVYDPSLDFTGAFASGFAAPVDVHAESDWVWVVDPLAPGGGTGKVYQYEAQSGDLHQQYGEGLDDPKSVAQYEGSRIPPALSIEGTCPGTLTVQISTLTPNAKLAIIGGTGLGGEYSIVPKGNCAGTVLNVPDPPRLLGAGIYTADAEGTFSASPNVGAPACGTQVQVLDLATCNTSNVVAI